MRKQKKKKKKNLSVYDAEELLREGKHTSNKLQSFSSRAHRQQQDRWLLFFFFFLSLFAFRKWCKLTRTGLPLLTHCTIFIFDFLSLQRRQPLSQKTILFVDTEHERCWESTYTVSYLRQKYVDCVLFSVKIKSCDKGREDNFFFETY